MFWIIVIYLRIRIKMVIRIDKIGIGRSLLMIEIIRINKWMFRRKGGEC